MENEREKRTAKEGKERKSSNLGWVKPRKGLKANKKKLTFFIMFFGRDLNKQ